MTSMLQTDVLPALGARAGDAVITSREILVMGLGESRTQELIADLVDDLSEPSVAYLASAGQVRVRLTARAPGEAQALALIRPLEDRIRERLGRDAVEGNHASIADAFGESLRERGLTVAVAESLTGGLMGSQLSLCGGSSDFFKGGLITYATESKRGLLGLDEGLLLGPGAISLEAAAAMAEEGARRFSASVGLSATGVAGPAEQEGKAVGTVFLGAWFDDRTEVRRIQAYGDRSHIRAQSVSAALDLGRRLILASE